MNKKIVVTGHAEIDLWEFIQNNDEGPEAPYRQPRSVDELLTMQTPKELVDELHSNDFLDWEIDSITLVDIEDETNDQ